MLPLAPPVASAGPGTLVAPPRAHTFGLRRITGREIALFLPGQRLQDPAGLDVVRLEATDDPGARDDDEVTIVAVDRGGRVFTNFGLLHATALSDAGTALGPFREPTDAAIDRDGRVVVTDTGNRRVVLLRHDGERLVPVRAVDGFESPVSVAADGAAGFLVCDRAAGRVWRLDFETGARTSFGLEVSFDEPVAVASTLRGERLGSGAPAHVVIADRGGRRLRSFRPDGTLRASREAASLDVSDASFDAIDLDYYGNVLAVDRAGNRVHKLRDDLYPLDTFGERGKREGEFLSPRGIAIHRRLGQVFVTEEDGGQYLWVGTDVRDVTLRPADRVMALAYTLTEASDVTLRILDENQDEVALLLKDQRQGAGPQRGSWDGTDAVGRSVAPGEYVLEVRARATYASRTSFEKRLLRAFRWARP
ncbi:MAG: hypothetical protein KC591_03820 [Gemmatimonadetes bacterium]|nr:hypothetical protein [Gemmatimonadota bacterium]